MRGKLFYTIPFCGICRIIPAHAGQTPPATRSSGYPRIIPAHAGQTNSRAARPARPADHPRACGANTSSIPVRNCRRGSSPRMRGKRPERRVPRRGQRIIPAHAGQTSRTSSAAHSSADHPRACGANMLHTSLSVKRFGSSPRMRGKQGHEEGRRLRQRIIPAHAGQTPPYTRPCAWCMDHPRACGANKGSPAACTGTTGSSPRMRGKPGGGAHGRGEGRIIPAHAGQTRRRTCGRPWLPDHPRACGANGVQHRPTQAQPGSSPRMRGKRRDRDRRDERQRIIPAHAGQTSTASCCAAVKTDHPRACGANMLTWIQALCDNGSSPRMRGKQGVPGEPGEDGRIIPAHAGQTGREDGPAR